MPPRKIVKSTKDSPEHQPEDEETLNQESSQNVSVLQDSERPTIEYRLSSIEETLNSIARTLNNKLENLDAKLEELASSQQFISDQFEGFKATNETILKQNSKLSKENEELRSKQAKLEAENKKLAQEIDDLAQYGRREMLEISGIPQTNDEDQNTIEKTIVTISRHLGVNISSDDIDAAHRLSKNPQANIIVKFKSRKMRDAIFSARSKLRGISTKDLAITTERAPSRIFINESLTARKKELMYKARLIKKEGHFKFLWSRNGSIWLRVKDNSPAVSIKNESDLTIFKAGSTNHTT